MSTTAQDDHAVTANPGQRLEDKPLPDGHPGKDGLVAVADRAPLFKSAGEPELAIGTDADDVSGQTAVRDMLASGHGFLVRAMPDAGPPKTYRSTCQVCKDPIPTPGNDPDWVCQYDEVSPATLDCNCAWCLRYQDYMYGRYKPQGGRPRQRCGKAECERKADATRKKRKRLQERRKRLLAELADVDELPPPTLADIEKALSSGQLNEVPEQYRETVRARLEQTRRDMLAARAGGVRKTT